MSNGTVEHPRWVRVGAGFLGSRFPGLWGCSSCSAPGLDPPALGFVGLEPSSRVRLLPSLDLEADVSSRNQVCLWSHGDLLASASFETAHPQRWWDGVHREERVVVVLGSCPGTSESAQPLDARWVGTCPVQVHVWSDGVGTAPAPDRPI